MAVNIVLLVVDSLRYDAIFGRPASKPPLRFFERLAGESVCFTRAYATECWTLPTHMSMFTGLLPSAHGAHFGSMAYREKAPTIAELLTEKGYATEVITRNPVFDGTLPGVTRGFARNTRVFAELSGLNPLALLLAASKPRFRRQVQSSGFFHPLQRERREFVAAFARSTVPADRKVLACVLDRLRESRRTGRSCFLFANLFDVHAPYPPGERSIFRPPTSRDGLLDMTLMPFVLPKLGSHRYLEPDFTITELATRLLRERYERAVALMDRKLESFYEVALEEGLLSDTLLVVTSDHGEAFGEHDLYLHDASVYDVHLHVPLFVRVPDCSPASIADVVSTREVFGLFCAASAGDPTQASILDPAYRDEHPVVVAEHTPYPHLNKARPCYRQPLRAAIAADQKIVMRGADAMAYDPASDPLEHQPSDVSVSDFQNLLQAFDRRRRRGDERRRL